METLLWLDDIRNPLEENGKWLVFSPINQPYKVIWVKNYKEFIDYIIQNGLPDAICFDHDLEPDELSEDNTEIIYGKTGFDCTKWLVDYCMDNELRLPLYNIQSANPAGKENIDKYLQNFIKSYD